MGDISMGVAYILSCCCCCHLAGDPGVDGTGPARKSKRDPREEIVDRQFKSKMYTRDDGGQIHVQPTPGPRMVGSAMGGGPSPGESLSGS
ncbi:hypothetical protein CPB85DRAFT_1339784 [Mucidula mucida]|nr:hypothetical protein CPB85DRAFT_1339784 [Mucidula mucida]